MSCVDARVAALLGKEASVVVPSGTTENQLALLCQTSRGDEVILGEDAPPSTDESGADEAWAGARFQVIGCGQLFPSNDLRDVLRAPARHGPSQSLVAVENPQDPAGGAVLDPQAMGAIAHVAHTAWVVLSLDGARLWNAAVACGRSEGELTAPLDTANVCLSKGPGQALRDVVRDAEGGV